MIYQSFNQLLDRISENTVRRKVAVAGAADRHVLEALLQAQKAGITDPVLIGEGSEIARNLEALGCLWKDYQIEDVSDPVQCGETAASLIREHKADFIMKGMIETREVLKPLVRKENGLSLGRTMSHVALNEIPGMNRLTALTDGGMIPHPTLEEKRDIILNAAEMFHALGYEEPSVAVLCAVEKVNPKMPETIDAEVLVRMSREGTISGCRVTGPISYDIAMSAEIAEEKGYSCADCGSFDILVVPSMVAGNLLNKSLTVTAGARMAGVIMGARVPVVVTSRSSSAGEKFLSLALASLMDIIV